MDKIKVMTCFGTRPEAIKMGPLVKVLEADENIESVVCVTAQHREMLDQVLEVFSIKPDYDLNVMKKSQTLMHITNAVLEGMDGVFEKEKPDIVLVHGDTSTTFVASLAAFYHKIAVGHVEAGLRTFNKYSPYPEEMNRKLTGTIADLHFSPTKTNESNLLREGVSKDRIFITGNTVIDALKTTVKENYTFLDNALRDLDFKNCKIITVTAHRRENLGKPLIEICEAILKIAKEHKEVTFVYPVHLNPKVRDTAYRVLGDVENVKLIEPLGVVDMHNLMARSYMIMTDSGGLQEEAPSLGKPVLVLRTETERPEAVEAGTVKVVGVVKDDIYREAKKLLTDKSAYDEMANAVNPYGDGLASVRTKDAICYFFGKKSTRPDNISY